MKSIVYSDGWKAYNKLSINGFHHRRINHDKTLVDGKVPVHGFENVRGYAKRRLKAYHGGFNHSFRLFLHEGSFRLNRRKDTSMIVVRKRFLIDP